MKAVEPQSPKDTEMCICGVRGAVPNHREVRRS